MVPAAARTIERRLFSTSSPVVTHDETLIRIAVRPCQTVDPHQQVPSFCKRAIVTVVLGISKRDQHLVEDDLVNEHVKACCAQPFCKAPGMQARSFDDLRHSAASQGTQARPKFDTARPAQHIPGV